MSIRITIPEKKLEELYLIKRLSTREIGLVFKCNRQTISNNLERLGIKKHSPAEARIRYHIRQDFNGSTEEKAYLVGFRLGDLNVYVPSSHSETIVARCHSTTKEQRSLMESLFGKYGKVTVSSSIYGENINCFLNTSFLFLLPKEDKVPSWVYRTKATMLAFIAGYVDAEGTFQINQERGRFALSTCDKLLLEQIHTFLLKYGILSVYKKAANRGDRSIGKYKFSNDVWRININQAHSLEKFIKLVKLYIKHEKRKRDMFTVLQNIAIRKEKGSI